MKRIYKIMSVFLKGEEWRPKKKRKCTQINLWSSFHRIWWRPNCKRLFKSKRHYESLDCKCSTPEDDYSPYHYLILKLLLRIHREKCTFPTLLLFSQAPTAGSSRVLSKNSYSCNLTEEEGGERVRSLAVRKPHVVRDYMSWFKACEQHKSYRTSTFSFL